MSDLKSLLAAEADRRTPTGIPPFAAVQARSVRRRRVRAAFAGAGVLAAVLAVTLVVSLVVRPGGGVDPSDAGGSSKFSSDRLAFEYPVE